MFCKPDPEVAPVLHKDPGLLQQLPVTGLELAADINARLGQQLAHGSTPKLVEQSDTGGHDLHAAVLKQPW